jgi:hypothetical protein
MHRLASVLMVAGLVASGCGGSDAPSSDAPSKAEFGKNADEVCANAEKSLSKIGQGATSREEIAQAVDKVIDETQNSLDDLKDLDRPDGSAGEAADKFIAALESDIKDKGIPALKKLRDAARSNDQKAAQEAVAELQAIDSGNTDKLAVAAGAKGCAN